MFLSPLYYTDDTMDIRNTLKKTIKEALKELGIEANLNDFVVEPTADLKFGDYQTNVSLIFSKKSAIKNPRELAEKIKEKIHRNMPVGLEKIDVAGPGFINFYLSRQFFTDLDQEILTNGDSYGRNNLYNNELVVVEYTDPNPFKDFHIGHLMNNTIGESISRIIEAGGAKLVRACYQGDVGLHVAKTIWGVRKMLIDSPETKKDFFGNFLGFGKNPKIWGKAYALGATKYEEDETAKKEIVEINKKVYERNDQTVNHIYDVGRKVSLEAFEKIYKKLDTKFNEYFFESQTTKFGIELVLKNIDNSVFEKSNGAVIFRGENYGLHTRVFINSEGLPTYDAKDLGLAKYKYDRVPYDKSIVITASEQDEYFKVMLKALEQIYPDLAKKTTHLSHGMLRLPSGKMSSRTGQVITGESLLEDIKVNVLEKMKDRQMSDREKNVVAEIVAVGALKFSILKQVAGKDIIFDFDKSLSFEGDSGPYLQYSYVRAMSVCEKAMNNGIKADLLKMPAETFELEKILSRFGEVVERAGGDLAPHYIVTYLLDLASTFNTFYANNKIVDKDDMYSPYKVALTEVFAKVIKNGLNLLGIKVPERM